MTSAPVSRAAIAAGRPEAPAPITMMSTSRSQTISLAVAAWDEAIEAAALMPTAAPAPKNFRRLRTFSSAFDAASLDVFDICFSQKPISALDGLVGMWEDVGFFWRFSQDRSWGLVSRAHFRATPGIARRA